MNSLTNRVMFEQYKQWFYGLCGFVFSLSVTVTKGAETFAYAAIGAFGAWSGTQIIKLIVASWKKSWRPLIKKYWYGWKRKNKG